MSPDLPAETIRSELLEWYAKNRRDLPWRRTRDPYAIWISETMLQQTRVAAVLGYYERFLKRFPDFSSLAGAPEDELLAHWAGLGYYYRARNLQKAARVMVEAGEFPTDYERIRGLPGVGDYTAAAVASIAFKLPYAVLDGNVFRVLSRLLADSTDISSGKGRKHFAALANSLLHREQPGDFNQAVMELGATVCLNKNPHCLLCPVWQHCAAKRLEQQNRFPVNRKKQVSVKQARTLFWIEREGHVLAWQRPATARLMPGFWELPESEQLPGIDPGQLLGAFRHGITVNNYMFSVVSCPPPAAAGDCQWLPLNDLSARPISTIFNKALKMVRKPARHAAAATF
jgi:A/G-specific adenine glycosylase